MEKMRTPYDSLREKLLEAGVFERRPLFYAIYTLILLSGLAISILNLTLIENVLLVILNAFLLAIVSMQMGYLGHDIAHHQVFRSKTVGRWLGSTVYALGLGISLEHWYGGHNEHHKHTNQLGKDPDIDLPLVFSDAQLALRGTWYKRFILPNQHWYFFLFMPLAYLNYILASIPWKIEKLRQPIRQYEFLLTVLHFTLFFWAVFGSLGLWMGVFFLATYAISTGAYAGFSFAPNHKGEKILLADVPITYETQITTTRNIHAGVFTDLAMGGLNYQIEHHLFPYLPRPNLSKAQRFVKDFCRERGIPYHEVSFTESVKEMYRSLKHYSRT